MSYKESNDWDNFEDKAKQLYIFLLPKLNNNLSTLVNQIGDLNGFEMWRFIAREEYPAHKNAKFYMELEIRQLSSSKCSNFNQTVELVVKLEKKAK